MYKRGFTLIELLVVIAIIAILAGILGPLIPGCSPGSTAETTTITVSRMEWDHRLIQGLVWTTDGQVYQVSRTSFGTEPETVYGQLREQGSYTIRLAHSLGARHSVIAEVLESQSPPAPVVPAEAPSWP